MSYTQQDYERDLKILEGAPDGATHYHEEDGKYLLSGEYDDFTWIADKSIWSKRECITLPIRSLSDIRALVSMYEQLQGQD